MEKLKGKIVIITGSSRGVGAEIALGMASQGAKVVLNYRKQARRAEKIKNSITENGGTAIAVEADITTEEGRKNLVEAAVDAFGSIDFLFLNASGGMEKEMEEGYALKLNKTSQVALVDQAVPIMNSGGRIVFVTSHQAHFIDTVETLPEYEPIARSKKAGETALTEKLDELAKKDIKLIIVSADMIDGTITAKLLERLRPGTLEQRRQEAGKLYTTEEFAHEIVKLAHADVHNGHVELVGGAHGFIED